MEKCVNVVGAGLAGSEAAWQLAKRGIKVRLYEMRPKRTHRLIIREILRNLSVQILCGPIN